MESTTGTGAAAPSRQSLIDRPISGVEHDSLSLALHSHGRAWLSPCHHALVADHEVA